MNELYEKAKIAYTEGNTETLEKIKSQLSNTRIPSIIKEEENKHIYKSYPTYDKPDFNHNIYQKAEFNRNKYKLITKPFEEVTKDKCSFTSFNLTENQKFLKNFMSPLTPYNAILLFHSVGVGKCHKKNTPILMYDGSVKMVQDVIVGDYVMGDDSTPRKVLSLTSGKDEMYDVIPIKGDKYTVNSEHILCLKYSGRGCITHHKKENTYTAAHIDNKRLKFVSKRFTTRELANEHLASYTLKDKLVEVSVKDYVALPKYIRNELKGYRTSVRFPPKPVDVDPYLIGVWLGDGSKRDPVITNQEATILLYLRKWCSTHKLSLNFQNNYNYRISSDNGDGNNIFLKALQKYNLINNKHIPDVYKINDRKVQMKLLAGLIDTDGSLIHEGYEITQKSKQVAMDLIYLCKSLGFAAYTNYCEKSCTYKGEKKTGRYYRTHIFGKGTDEIPVLVPRKKAQPRKQIKDVLVTGITVESVGRGTYYGFAVDGNHKYVLGDFTVTHNSCSAISIAEQFISEYKKKVLVIVPPNIRDNFRKQIFDINKVGVLNGTYDDSSNQCTGMTYPNLVPDRHVLNKDALDAKVKKVINERYQFKGAIEFANDYDNIKKKIDATETSENRRNKKFDAKLKDIYSNRMFIIDEVHNLRLASEASQKRVPPKLMHVMKVAENVKLVLLTATPMFNNVTEIVWLLNLMLTNDKRPTIHTREIFENGNLTKEGKQKLIEVSRGYISFMRGENPYSFPTRIYPTINKDSKVFTANNKPQYDIFNVKITESNKLENLELIKSQMSTYQQSIYSRLEKQLKKVDLEGEEKLMDDENEFEENDEQNGTDIQMGLQISNVVYPSLNDEANLRDYYGNSKLHPTFNKCFPKVSAKSKLLKVKYDSKIVREFGEFFAPDKLGEFAPKLKTITDYIAKSEGIVYIYSSYIYSGIIPLAIALEHMGFSKYGNNNILHTDKSIKPFKVKNKTAQYIILSASSEISPNNKEEINVAKTAANAEGEIIKVIIGSNVATEGIDFKNIREIHILEPWYHLNKIEQIIGRGVRYCSHIDLPLEKRNTTIYKHVNTRDNDNRETIDVRIYRIADNKQEKITKVESVLKQNAVDCLLNHNVLYFDPEKVNMSINLKTSQGNIIKEFKIGDTSTKSLKCYPKKTPILSLDTSTYDMYFLDDDIEIYVSHIVNLFKINSIYTFKEIQTGIQKTLDSIEQDVLMYALNRMLVHKRKVFDKNNTVGYIIYRSNKYIFQKYNKPDLRMTIEERNDPKHVYNMSRKRLDIKYLVNKSKEIKDIVSASDTYKVVKERVRELSDIIKNKGYTQVIYDYVIDRLSQNQLLIIVEDIFDIINKKTSLNDVQKIIHKSLSASGAFLTMEENKYYVDIYGKTETYYIFKNDKFIKCPLIDKFKMENLEKELQTTYLDTYGSVKNIEGYISSKPDKHRFKSIVRDKDGKAGSSSGSVCFNNSKLKVKPFKELIVSLDNSFENLKGTNKLILCDIYELILRKHMPNKFLRPYQYYLLEDKKFD